MTFEGEIAVQLLVIDDSGRQVDVAPEGVGIGELRLRRWQVHQVTMATREFEGTAAYLIKVNYELRLRPDLPPMRWYELRLDLGKDTSATFVDAIPRTARTSQNASSHALNDYLEFVPADPGCAGQVHLRAVDGRVTLYDVPGSSVRWLHSSDDVEGVHPGAHSAWVVLLLPEHRRQQAVSLSVRYDLRNVEDSPYRPVQEPADFVITLPEVDVAPSVSPVTQARRCLPVTNTISAFICYAHDTPDHKNNVRRLAEVLLDAGIDVHLDQYDVGPRKDWGHWAITQFEDRGFVLVIASPMCASVGNGTADGDQHRGLRAELEILRSLYQRHPAWAQYVLPVVLPEQSKEGIPLFLAPETKDYYPVDDYTKAGVEYLLTAMRATEPRTWPLVQSDPPITR